MHGPFLEADVVWQRAAVDEHAAELVHAALPCLRGRQVSYLCKLTLLVGLAYEGDWLLDRFALFDNH